MKNIIAAGCLLFMSVQAQAYDFTPFFLSATTTAHLKNHIYFDWNFKNEYAMCVDKAKGFTTFADEEGGSVRRFKQDWELPSPSTKMPLDVFMQKARASAVELKKRCLDVNLGVQGDTYENRKEEIYAGRSYSANPEVANRYALAYAQALRDNGIVPGWKHFPGHTQNIRVETSNANFKSGAWEQGVDTSSREFVISHSEAFNNHGAYDYLMLSQTIYPSIGKRPALLEPEIIRLAKERQPHSLLVTDDLSLLNLSDEDILFIFRNSDLMMALDYHMVGRIYEVLNRALKSGKLTQDEIGDKLAHIEAWKKARS
ncbi:Beta-hexosaminidase A precursor [Caballeronia peredens]|nr:Beta-hexosaminidase A precursor [Caballeronia peredens]